MFMQFMQKSNISTIIQDFLKKINSLISIYHIVSISITILVIISLIVFIKYKEFENYEPLSYIEGINEGNVSKNEDSRIFASINGKTYTYKWCSGSSRILDKNKIYFKNEEEAKRSGRTLSKKCK